ncbi:hypothetical protein EG329_013059 [Mollisiaceae sp. DMI_Dod_QoI]|nr:hypothetical protein EG329_013059 [Helotiales sp. DMI_Dod_QoI]
MAETSEYVFGLSLGLLIVFLYFLQTLEPHQKIIIRESSPPPSPQLSPRDPQLPPEPYDERTIISSITTLYDLLTALGYLEGDEIIYPPPSSHSINLDLCRTLNLDERVVFLMQLLPCPKSIDDSYHFDLIQDSRALAYVDEGGIEEGRDPENAGTHEELKLDYLLPTDVALTIGGRYGTSLVLGTKDSGYFLLCVP